MIDPLSRLARLRLGTRDAHARIESVPALARLLAPDLTVAEYVAVLRHMHGFLCDFEPAIAAALADHRQAAVLLDGGRPRALAEDLAWFGASPQPLDAAPPALSGPAAALGALYVIEGSGLGGRVIARHLAASLGVAPGTGGSFYGGPTAEGARLRWQRLCALLDPADPVGDPMGGPIDDDALLAGALATFRFLDRWMRGIDPADHHRRSPGAEVAA
jgi:heme oxygenase